MAYGGYSPKLRNAVIKAAKHYGIPDAADELIATTLVESGGRLDAVGDNGNSGGPFQENSAGRGAGIPMKDRFNPEKSAMRAAKEFKAFVDKGHSPKGFNPGLAYAAQRPADKADYIAKLNARLADARKILGGGAPSADAGNSLNAPIEGGNQPGDPVGVDTSSATAPQPEDKLGPALDSALLNRKQESASDRLRAVVNGVIDQDIANRQAEAQAPDEPPPAVQGQAAKNAAETIGQEADPSDSQAVNAAKEHIGVPYSWGGGTPSGPSEGFGKGAGTVGFDCSSLVQYAWAKAGVKLPRTTYDQINVGKAVPNLAQAKPWDLLFPSKGHVQMYVGQGKIIEAPRTGGKVQIVAPRDSYIAIRRPG